MKSLYLDIMISLCDTEVNIFYKKHIKHYTKFTLLFYEEYLTFFEHLSNYTLQKTYIINEIIIP